MAAHFRMWSVYRVHFKPLYQTNNLYSALVRQHELEQEVRAIAGKNGKTRKTGRGKA